MMIKTQKYSKLPAIVMIFQTMLNFLIKVSIPKNN